MHRRTPHLRAVLRVFALLAIGALVESACATPPMNDTCPVGGSGGVGFVIPPEGAVIFGDLTDATRDTVDVACVGALGGVDVYYTLTPTSNGVYVFDTCGSSIDTVLTVHTTCPTAATNQVPGACNDDACGLQSRLTAYLFAGQPYVVRVGTYDDTTATGPFTLSTSFTPSPSNDVCGGNMPMLSLNVPAFGNNGGAGSDITVSPSGLCGTFSGSGGGADVWYRFISPSDGAYVLSTCGGGSLDTVLSIHANCPTSGSDLIACNDDAGAAGCPSNRFASKLTVALSGGITYFVRVAGFRVGTGMGTPATGPFSLLVSSAPDDFGACCDGSNACQLTLATGCFGTYLGNSTACQPSSCAGGIGVCCIGALCKLVTSGECIVPVGDPAGAVFLNDIQCNPAGNGFAPCCHADFDKSGQTNVQDVFAYLNSWFQSSPLAVVEGDGVQFPGVQDIFAYLNLWFAGGC